jgi:hypothetical protein
LSNAEDLLENLSGIQKLKKNAGPYPFILNACFNTQKKHIGQIVCSGVVSTSEEKKLEIMATSIKVL